MSKSLVLALGAGGAAAAAVVASAASIGSVNSTDLGAGTSVVASCDSDGIDVSYTTAYDGTTGAYKVATVDLDGLAAACDGQAIEITLAGPTATVLQTVSGTVSGATQSFPVSSVPAASLTQVAVVISG